MTVLNIGLAIKHPVRKPIVPYSAFVNGRKAVACSINVVSVADNLFDHVVFKYTLYSENREWTGEGAYELKGTDYAIWDRNPETAFQIVADGIGVEFTPYPCGTFFGTGGE